MCESLLERLLRAVPRAAALHGWAALVVLAVAILLQPAAAVAGQLALARAAGQPGQSVTVPLTYRQWMGSPAAGLATDIVFDPTALTHPHCESGAALDDVGDAAKTVTCAEPQPGLLRLVVFGFNLSPVPDGEVARVTFDVTVGARRRRYLLRHTPGAADAEGTDFPLARRNGVVRVNGR